MSTAQSRKQAAASRLRQIRSKAARLDSAVECRFVADVMLGRLAKWLRIAGFDVLYSNSFTDDELVSCSAIENRILLSRDTRLLVRKAVKQFIFLESADVRDQVRQVFRLTRTSSLPLLMTRCLACNEPLSEISHESVKDLVPPFVFATQRHFKSCQRCKRVYWAGTHRQSALRILRALMLDTES